MMKRQISLVTFVNDFLPESFNKSRVMMVSTVNNRQFAFRQIKHIRKLTVQLQHTHNSMN